MKDNSEYDRRADNPGENTIRKALDLAKDCISIATRLGAGLGIILVTLYTVREGILFPIQSAAQTASTVVISLVFAAQAAFVVLFSGFLIYIPGEFFTWVWRRVTKQDGNSLPSGFWLLALLWLFFIALTALGLLVEWPNVSSMVFPRLIAMIGIGGIIYSVVKWGAAFRSWPAIAGILVVIFSIFIRGGFDKSLTIRAMEMLGIRSTDSELIVASQKTHQLIQKHSRLTGIAFGSCALNGDEWLLEGTTIIWRGLGGPASIRVTDVASNRNFLVFVDENSLDVVQNLQLNPVHPCDTLKTLDESGEPKTSS